MTRLCFVHNVPWPPVTYVGPVEGSPALQSCRRPGLLRVNWVAGAAHRPTGHWPPATGWACRPTWAILRPVVACWWVVGSSTVAGSILHQTRSRHLWPDEPNTACYCSFCETGEWSHKGPQILQAAGHRTQGPAGLSGQPIGQRFARRKY